jgi:hypothetical protein
VIIKISYSILAIRDNNAGMYQQVHYW